MSLNWNISNCKDHETLQTDAEWPITHNLIWATMPIGISEITKENWTECYARIAVWEGIVGAFLTSKDKDGEYKSRPFTPEDIFKRIGLYTNASRMSRPQWQTYIGKYLSEKADTYKKTAAQSEKTEP